MVRLVDVDLLEHYMPREWLREDRTRSLPYPAYLSFRLWVAKPVVPSSQRHLRHLVEVR